MFFLTVFSFLFKTELIIELWSRVLLKNTAKCLDIQPDKFDEIRRGSLDKEKIPQKTKSRLRPWQRRNLLLLIAKER